MSALLPSSVRAALDSLSEGLSRNVLSKRSDAITAGYQKRFNSSKELRQSNDALTYALTRMPATFAASRRSLLKLQEAMPDLHPQSLLDVGCGPGTASFAAQAVFEGIKDFKLLDRNGPFLELARQLAAAALPKIGVSIEPQDIAICTTFPKSDLVIASYVLAELTSAIQAQFIDRLWAASNQALVLIEPGTPDGFERLKVARLALIKQSGFIAAPCTHEGVCPLPSTKPEMPSWCRFLERVQRSRDHRILKSADRSYEDEPFAYLVVVRERPLARENGRIIGRTHENKFEIQIPICDETGVSKIHIPKRDKKRYKDYNGLEWGDTVLNQIQPLKKQDEEWAVPQQKS